MANEENLIPFSERTENELREMTKKGGENSGRSRRAKKKQKDYIAMLMGLPINSGDVKEKLSEMGVADEMHTNELRIAFRLFQLAAEGDLAAIKYIDERMGNSPQLKLKENELKLQREKLNINRGDKQQSTKPKLAELIKKMPEVWGEAEE